MKDVIRPHDSILQIRACFALEAQCLFHVEDNQLTARKLEHEVADRRHGNLRRHQPTLCWQELRIAFRHLDRGLLRQDIEQIVDFDAKAFTA